MMRLTDTAVLGRVKHTKPHCTIVFICKLTFLHGVARVLLRMYTFIVHVNLVLLLIIGITALQLQ